MSAPPPDPLPDPLPDSLFDSPFDPLWIGACHGRHNGTRATVTATRDDTGPEPYACTCTCTCWSASTPPRPISTAPAGPPADGQPN
ncbi:hypothetical protein AADR41_21650 [Streptomyces sp. CLV115]|uniref:hypothetical protein n=1 Tax=Streptomyces sp. CLV115 TaxID=3138502 RepID=UPI00313B39CD